MPTFSAMCSNLALAGELLFAGLSSFLSLVGLYFGGTEGDIEGDIGGELMRGEFGGSVMPSREPSLKRLW